MSEQKVILVTGGRSGLGKVIALYLVSKGHTVYGTSRTASASEVDGIRYISLDINSDTDSTNAINEIMRRESHIDVIINNAGITLAGPTLDYSPSDFKKILDTNVIGAFRLIKAAFSFPTKPQLVINITSLNGFLSFPNFGLYSASKFAMEALGLALRYELASSTKVVNVAPGAIYAESSKKCLINQPERNYGFFDGSCPLRTRKT
jgi:NAD(P)-dependent dehydrogenase (short-subunit alcohol dehydrogenase family)